MYNGPIRGGSRGGRDQFNWESVKGDKDREFYLGHSVKASVGRWQKGKDLLWYTREKNDQQGDLHSEVQAVKEREEELMLEALGIKKRKAPTLGGNKLEGHEMQELLRRGSGEVGEETGEEDRVKGLGFKAGNVGGTVEHEVLEGVGLDDAPLLGTKRPMKLENVHEGNVEREEGVGGKREGRKKDKRKDKKGKKEKKSSSKKKRKHKRKTPESGGLSSESDVEAKRRRKDPRHSRQGGKRHEHGDGSPFEDKERSKRGASVHDRFDGRIERRGKMSHGVHDYVRRERERGKVQNRNDTSRVHKKERRKRVHASRSCSRSQSRDRCKKPRRSSSWSN